jgi:hypothetical protein
MNQAFLLLADDAVKVSGMELIDLPDSLELILRFVLNFAVILILVRWLYYSVAKRKDYLFTYILISCIVFFLCYLLENVKLQIGFALGLFAIFGIIRYRTDSMPIKEMTYLFLVIGVSVINALANKKTSIVEVLFTNAAIIGITYALEKVWLIKHESSKIITYEKIHLILPEKRQELIDDLETRTGIRKIKRVEIGKINFLKDTCRVTIFFDEYSTGVNYEDSGKGANSDDDED